MRIAQLSTASAGKRAAQTARLPDDGHGPLGWLYTPSGDVTALRTGSLMISWIKRLAGRTDIALAGLRQRGRRLGDLETIAALKNSL